MKDKKLKNFGKSLEKAILSNHPSIEKFAYENDIRKQTLSLLIRGEREPKLSTLLKIVDALEITPNDLLGYKNLKS